MQVTCLIFRHNLYEHSPFRVHFFLDGCVKISLVTFSVFCDHHLGFLIGQVLDALLAAKMEFDPNPFIVSIDQTVSVAGKSVHVAEGGGDTPVTHRNGQLKQGFRQRCPEIPIGVRTAHIGSGVPLDGVVQVNEFFRISEEKYRCIVSNKIPVSFLGVVLHGKAANIAFCVSGTTFAGHC